MKKTKSSEYLPLQTIHIKYPTDIKSLHDKTFYHRNNVNIYNVVVIWSIVKG